MLSGPDKSLHFYWLHACISDGEGFRVKTSGWEGDIRYTGEDRITPEDADFPVWKWIHGHRSKFPPLVSQSDFARLSQTFRLKAPEPKCPDDGYYFVAVEWSPAATARKALEKANEIRPLPRPLKILDGDSEEPSQLFPHLTGLLHGWGEVFGFSGGKCDAYHPLAKDFKALQAGIESLYD